MTLTNCVALVTGGGGNLGFASASALAAAGARVAVVDIVAEAAQHTVERIGEAGGQAISIQADLGVEDDIRRAVKRTVREWGRLDILHNNAADMNPDTIDTTVCDLDAAVFARIFNINVIGYALAAKHAIPHMIRQRGGVIINMASVMGHVAELQRVMYGTTKAAVLGLTKNIATQHGADGIRCLSLSPGVIMTPGISAHLTPEEVDSFRQHTPIARLGLPEDIGALVAFLASSSAQFITGTDIVVDGGMLAHSPTFADERKWLAGA